MNFPEWLGKGNRDGQKEPCKKNQFFLPWWAKTTVSFCPLRVSLNGSMFQTLTREAFSEPTSYSGSPDEVSALRATIIQENSSVNKAHMKSAHKFRREENS